jgi:hypothetical protein
MLILKSGGLLEEPYVVRVEQNDIRFVQVNLFFVTSQLSTVTNQPVDIWNMERGEIYNLGLQHRELHRLVPVARDHPNRMISLQDRDDLDLGTPIQSHVKLFVQEPQQFHLTSSPFNQIGP